MPQVAPAILPEMYKIFIDPEHYSISLRKMSVEIFNSIVMVISEMSEYDAVSIFAIKLTLTSKFRKKFLRRLVKSFCFHI